MFNSHWFTRAYFSNDDFVEQNQSHMKLIKKKKKKVPFLLFEYTYAK